jgi:hypothetical protein
MIAEGAFQPISSQTHPGLIWEYINTPFLHQGKNLVTPKLKKDMGMLSQV